MSRALALVTLLLVACLGTGCSTLAKPDGATVAQLSQLPYPKDAPLGDDLDIIVQQKGSTIALSNRTASVYPNAQVWLNQQYVAHVEAIDIGAGQRVALSKFINRHGEHYPVGGPLSPDKGYPVVLAEVFDPVAGKRHRLVVRKKDAAGFFGTLRGEMSGNTAPVGGGSEY